MGRTRAKSPVGRLSDQQIEILLWLSVRTAVLHTEHSFVDWSPTEYVKDTYGVVTSGEVAAASRRVASLVDRRLLEREEKRLSLTNRGWSVLVKWRKELSELVELDRNRRDFEELSRQRLNVNETLSIIAEVIKGERGMTWINDRENLETREEIPPESKRREMLRHTFDTLFLLDAQMSSQQRCLLDYGEHIVKRLAARLNLPMD